MATIIPAIKGTLGNTTFYEATMKVSDLVMSVRPPTELEEWAGFSIEERLQRDPDLKRIKNDLAPYIANSSDRFFGSIIVLVYKGELVWESITAFAKSIPAAYQGYVESMGFLTIKGVTLVVLDGQHRLRALRAVHLGEISGPAAGSVPNDDVCVIFVRHETNMKTRRIFNVVNRYAKQTGRGDNIITSEDDGYAILSRTLLADEAVLGRRAVGSEQKDFVEWKRNTLGTRSLPFTTISAIYESVKLILGHNGVPALKEQQRPSDDDLQHYEELVIAFWDELMSRVKVFKHAGTDMTVIPEYRKDDKPTALLFKPAGQIALVDGLIRAAKEAGLTLEKAMDRVNSISDWSMSNPMWGDIIIKSGGTIDASSDARRRMATLVAYLLGADSMPEDHKLSTWEMYNGARHKGALEAWKESDFTDEGELEDLPKPVAGKPFTIADARKILSAAESEAGTETE